MEWERGTYRCQCGQPARGNGQSWCKACHAAYMRAHRPKHSEMTPEQRQRSNARSYANVYQRRGLLDPKPCERCGSAGAQKHHDDYGQPLKVRWFCRLCHLALHRETAREQVEVA